ncbi:MAG: sugar O-acetyltransferase [Ruminococcus sp.]|nr:sugar O-acetyltransferase [Ruminococcus sp.]MDY3894736.1 sugar O-acetyltransferase [Candidatus Fimenecus sp.]
MEHPEIPLNCFFNGCYNPDYERDIKAAKDICYKYNNLNPNDEKSKSDILRSFLGKFGKDAVFVAPFWCDYGYRISVGDRFYANHNLVIQDGGGVTFGDDVFIGPNCCFTTAEHAVDPSLRKQGIEIAKPISVGNNVWIGAGSTVLAGVTIGDNSVIGAGSVVTSDIPPNVVAVGVPCRVMREITPDDKNKYPFYDKIKLDPNGDNEK